MTEENNGGGAGYVKPELRKHERLTQITFSEGVPAVSIGKNIGAASSSTKKEDGYSKPRLKHAKEKVKRVKNRELADQNREEQHNSARSEGRSQLSNSKEEEPLF